MFIAVVTNIASDNIPAVVDTPGEACMGGKYSEWIQRNICLMVQ